MGMAITSWPGFGRIKGLINSLQSKVQQYENETDANFEAYRRRQLIAGNQRRLDDNNRTAQGRRLSAQNRFYDPNLGFSDDVDGRWTQGSMSSSFNSQYNRGNRGFLNAIGQPANWAGFRNGRTVWNRNNMGSSFAACTDGLSDGKQFRTREQGLACQSAYNEYHDYRTVYETRLKAGIAAMRRGWPDVQIRSSNGAPGFTVRVKGWVPSERKFLWGSYGQMPNWLAGFCSAKNQPYGIGNANNPRLPVPQGRRLSGYNLGVGYASACRGTYTNIRSRYFRYVNSLRGINRTEARHDVSLFTNWFYDFSKAYLFGIPQPQNNAPSPADSFGRQTITQDVPGGRRTRSQSWYEMTGWTPRPVFSTSRGFVD